LDAWTFYDWKAISHILTRKIRFRIDQSVSILAVGGRGENLTEPIGALNGSMQPLQEVYGIYWPAQNLHWAISKQGNKKGLDFSGFWANIPASSLARRASLTRYGSVSQDVLLSWAWATNFIVANTSITVKGRRTEASASSELSLVHIGS
jgi:hypothetical protein